MAEAMTDRTELMVVSAPSYAHGVVDPVRDVAGAAFAQGVRCHVDACIGGWVLPYAARLGRPVPPWSFAVEGVTSISVDLHKYGYAPKGTSVLLHRSPQLRRPQFFASADWPGYTMLNSTMQSTKSGGPLAGAWAVVNTIGDDGYLELTRVVLDGVDRLVRGIDAIPQLSVVAPPDSTLVAVAADDSCDVFTITDAMTRAGWYVQPQLSFRGDRPTIHLSLSAATAPLVDEFLDALRAAVTAAVAAGPIRIGSDMVAFVGALDPADLSEEDFDGLLAAVGMGGAGRTAALPESMAEINALLDLATPPLREALLVAFLDRLTRPVRQDG
jgi:glutamate/tyrosine decarboxylase-like PLP-dependent enzyme